MQTIVAIIGAIAVAAFGWRLLRGVEKGNSMKHINITTVLVLLALLLGGMPARGKNSRAMTAVASDTTGPRRKTKLVLVL